MFPGMVFPLTVGRERSRALRHRRRCAASVRSASCCRRKPDVEEPGPDDLHWVGTDRQRAALHHDSGRSAPRGRAQGCSRFRVLQFLDGYPFTVARVQYHRRPRSTSTRTSKGARARLKQRAVEILQLLPQVPEEMVAALQGVEDPARLADFIAGLMDISAEEKQALLGNLRPRRRGLDKLLELLAHRIEVLKVSRDIDERTRESIGDVNRKHLLREQMRTIQKELGEGDEGAAEIAELDKAITEAQHAGGSGKAGAQGV